MKRRGKTEVETPAVAREMTAVQGRIVAAAVELFGERGYAATATSEIARRAGVAEGTIFRYYPTKKELLVGAVRPLMAHVMTAEMRERVERVLGADYGSAEAFVRAVAADRLEFAREHPALIRLILQEASFHPELRAEFRATVIAVFLPLLATAIVRLQAKGLVAPVPMTSAARIVVTAIVGFILPRLLLAPDADWDDEMELDLIARVIGRGLAAG
jgi:AcrR family transcriptional regulator